MIGTKNLKVDISEETNNEINRKIQVFVDAMSEKKQSVDYYIKNRSVKAEKAIEDIFLGKKAEYFVSIGLFREFKIPYTEPDLSIRKGKKKGWDADLTIPGVNVHVKACSDKTVKYCKDFSWTFQYSNKSGKNGKDKIFEDDKDVVALVYLPNPLSNIAEIKVISYWRDLSEHLKDPLKPTLIGMKKCLYYKDLENL